MQVPNVIPRPTLHRLFQTLANQRPTMSLAEKKALAGPDSFVFDNAEWIKLWYDPGHMVHSACGALTAYRAITVSGDLLWYVSSTTGEPAYHSCADDPCVAIDEALQSRERRNTVMVRWDEIEEIAKDLWRGRQKFDVLLEDAQASPLSAQEIDGFMNSVGLGNLTRISGRTAAMLMKIEPQLGFVIFEAWQRHLAIRPRLVPVEVQIAVS